MNPPLPRIHRPPVFLSLRPHVLAHVLERGFVQGGFLFGHGYTKVDYPPLARVLRHACPVDPGHDHVAVWPAMRVASGQ